jgi:hypothetical protein
MIEEIKDFLLCLNGENHVFLVHHKFLCIFIDLQALVNEWNYLFMQSILKC